MPLVINSNFKPNVFFRHRHFSTVAPSLFRKIKGIEYNRKRLETPDGDFIDLDFSTVNSSTIVIITHGLEGNSDRMYLKGMVQSVNSEGWDAVALNLRGCSGEVNNLYLSYHSGKTDDLELLIHHILKNHKYEKIMLIGFSLGGNITLKFLGEQGTDINSKIKGAVAISVPVDLKDSAAQLAKKSNAIYMKRFVKMLKPKLLEKSKRFPEQAPGKENILLIKDFYDFDELYTAPAHGFKNAEDYWEKCSSKPVLPAIAIPTLLINAKNDPFLGPLSYPKKEAENSKWFYLETPNYGGHVGFASHFKMDGQLWDEKQAMLFLKPVL